MDNIELDFPNKNIYSRKNISNNMVNLPKEQIIRNRVINTNNTLNNKSGGKVTNIYPVSIPRNRCVINKNKRRRKVKLMKRRIAFLAIVTIFGVGTITVTVKFASWLFQKNDANKKITIQQVEFDEDSLMADNSSLMPNINSIDYDNISVEDNNSLMPNINSIDDDSISVEDNNKALVSNYCKIYGLNSERIYNKIVNDTNSFTNFNLPNVTCKGKQKVVSIDNPELFILYYCRAISQLPANFGVTLEEISADITTDINPFDFDIVDRYQYYGNLIIRYCDLLGNEDPILIFSIIQAETGWDSTMLKEQNNPAGIKFHGGNNFETFNSPEAGIIESILEVNKYVDILNHQQKSISIENIGAIHCPLATGEYINKYWVTNVTNIYNQVNNNPLEYMPNYEIFQKQNKKCYIN